MLQYIIDAYEQKNKEEGFYKRKKNMNVIYKIALCLVFLEVIISCVFLFYENLKGFFGGTISIIVTYFIYICVFTRLRRKNWHENIKEYNESLNGLKDILKEKNINYYSKKRILILIKQCENSIDKIKSVKEKSKSEINNFVEKYIIPIIAFSVGILNNEIKSNDMLYICLISIVIIVLLNISIKGISYMIDDAEGNKVEEREYMRDKLQDLLIRDFEVEDKDLYVNE